MVATARIADAPQIFNRICQVASMCMCPPTASRSIHPFLRGSHVDHAYVTTSAAIIRIPCDGGYQFTIIMCYRKFGYLSKIRVLPSKTLPQTLDLENFVAARRPSQRVVRLVQ